MTTTMIRPAPELAAGRAREIHTAWMADAEMAAALDGCTKYSSDWSDDYGQFLIPHYSVERDAPQLVAEAVRAMALKSAVFELTGDELASELPVSVPVDVACHALTAQFQALARVQTRTGHPFIHSTVNEHIVDTPWRAGDYAHQAYRAAFGPASERYWIDADEAERRRVVLDARYASIGITERGMASAIDFCATA